MGFGVSLKTTQKKGRARVELSPEEKISGAKVYVSLGGP